MQPCRIILQPCRTVPRLNYAGRFARVEQLGEPDAEGWMRVLMRFQFEEDACEFALGLGTRVKVLEPASLRERVVRAAESVVAFYADAPARA